VPRVPTDIPDYVCIPTMTRTQAGDAACDHDFERRETDEDVYWACRKCGEHWAAEVLQ